MASDRDSGAVTSYPQWLDDSPTFEEEKEVKEAPRTPTVTRATRQ